jgi:glycosyltransferase involved in cell wall biosynthesis
MILRDRLDVFWGTNNMLPLGLPWELAKVLTIHDLLWPLYSKIADPFHRCMYWLFFERSVRQADRIISVSQSTAADLQRIWKVPASKIQVIQHGVGLACKPQDQRAAFEVVANKYGVPKDYILTVGTVAPHKNLITVVKAMKILRGRGELSLQLLAVGAQGRNNSRVLKEVWASGLTGEDIRFLGFVPDEDLPVLYSGSSLFVFPSLYEGFGLPLVEAMACGVPVVASNTSSIPEVVGDAALLVPPTQPEAFAEAILRVRRDKDLRTTMIEKGLGQAACFRWDMAARQLLACMWKAVDEKCSQKGHG